MKEGFEGFNIPPKESLDEEETQGEGEFVVDEEGFKPINSEEILAELRKRGNGETLDEAA